MPPIEASRANQHIGDEERLVGVDAGELRRLGVAADGVEVAAERRPVHDEIGEDDQDRGDPDRHRNAEQHAEAEEFPNSTGMP